jgi:hypothetical protein
MIVTTLTNHTRLINMYYLVDTKTNKPIVKSEDKAELKRLIKRLYTYQHWAIVQKDH